MAKQQHDLTSLNISSKGPFSWDNEDDLGMGNKLGVWDYETDDNVIVYYRRDKDAVQQGRAQAILSSAESILDDLGILFDIEFPHINDNGRKLSLYLVNNAEESRSVLNKLCPDHQTPRSQDVSSVIEMGPLGIKCNGIVINQECFGYDRYGKPNYEVPLRRELSRYAYLSNMNLDKHSTDNEWITAGFVEYFANYDTIDSLLSKDMVNYLEKVKFPSDLFPGKQGPDAAALFLDYCGKTYGKEGLSEMIEYSFANNAVGYFDEKAINCDSLYNTWLLSVKEKFQPAPPPPPVEAKEEKKSKKNEK